MTRKSGLGKGLDSLIPNSSTVPSTKSTKFSTKSEENVDKPVENPVDNFSTAAFSFFFAYLPHPVD